MNNNNKRTKQKQKKRRNKTKACRPISEGKFELQHEAADLQWISDFVLFISLAFLTWL